MSAVQAERLNEDMDWQVIDRELRKLATDRGQLDAHEAFLLCCAARQEIWRKVGRASFLEYLEEVLGYTPKCARERLRVAQALDAVPELAKALTTGEQSYSAIRELTRVATPETQTAWREAARGKNVRQIEELVSVHAPGDRPSDPPRPDLKPRVIRFEISPATFARLRQVQQVLAEECNGQLDDDALIETLCAAVLDGSGNEFDQGRARHQILMTICEVCQQGWQQGAGREIAVTATDVEIAECDAQRVGNDQEPGRATQDIPPKTRRFVFNRDHHKCKVPGCRSARNLDVHHIVPRHLGGDHEPENLTVLCSGHHRSHHEGALLISGRAPDLTMTWRAMPHVGHELSAAHVGHAEARHGSDARATTPSPPVVSDVGFTSRALLPTKYDRVALKTRAIQAMTTAGFHRATSRSLVEAALGSMPQLPTLEQLLKEALRLSRSL